MLKKQPAPPELQLHPAFKLTPFEKLASALAQVPKAEADALEAKRPKKAKPKRRPSE